MCYFAIFNPPETLQGFWLFLWFAGFAVALRTFMTLIGDVGERRHDGGERLMMTGWPFQRSCRIARMRSVRCPDCGGRIMANARVCSQCGYAFGG